jgi:prophage regulatory protein
MDRNRLIRLPEVQRRVSIGRSTIWLWIKEGRFPKGIKLSKNVTVWNESEIDAFVEGNWHV